MALEPVLIKIADLVQLDDPDDDDLLVILDDSEPLDVNKVKCIRFADLSILIRLEVCPEQFTSAFNALRWYTSVDVQYTPSALWANSALTPSGFQAINSAVEAHVGAYETINIPLMEGSYVLIMCCAKGPDFGTSYLVVDDGTPTASQDFYAAALTENNQMEFAFDVVENGMHELKFVQDGKNASSSDYRFGGSMFVIYRSG